MFRVFGAYCFAPGLWAEGGPLSSAPLVRRNARLSADIETRSRVFVGRRRKRQARLLRDINGLLHAERKTLLEPRDDIMFALELEGPVVVDQPVESAVERLAEVGSTST